MYTYSFTLVKIYGILYSSYLWSRKVKLALRQIGDLSLSPLVVSLNFELYEYLFQKYIKFNLNKMSGMYWNSTTTTKTTDKI